MKKSSVIIIALLALIIGLLVGELGSKGRSAAPAIVHDDQPVFTWLMKDHVLRCGYMVYAPYISRDPNTGELSGSFYELTEALAKFLQLKVDWVQETTPATYVEDIKTGRYDVFCGGLWPYHDSAPYMAYTTSAFYVGYYLYVRSDDHRFDTFDLADINNSQFKFATLDGESSAQIRDEDFPKTKPVAIPNMSDVSILLLDLVNRKADITATDPSVAGLFLKTHPGTIRPLFPTQPIRVFANVWGVPIREQKLVNLLNAGVGELVARGYTNTMAQKYHTGNNAYFPTAKPYLLPDLKK